jgi:hypothetical protein
MVVVAAVVVVRMLLVEPVLVIDSGHRMWVRKASQYFHLKFAANLDPASTHAR